MQSTQKVRATGAGSVRDILGSNRIQSLVLRAASHVILITATIIIVYPVVWMVMGSLKSPAELTTNVWAPPRVPMWSNYPAAWEQGMLGRAFMNSVIVSSTVVIITTAVAALAGFGFARMSFRFSLPIFLVFVFTMQAGAPIVPLYVLLVRMGITDTHLGLIMPQVAGGLPLAIFIFRAFFQSIPQELLDAGKVDGCTDLTVFSRIVVPISGPAVATVSILQFLGSWNEFTLPLILVRSPGMRTLPLTISSFVWEFGRTDWTLVFCALTVGSLPMVLLYVFMQRWFIQGLTEGAVKG